MIASKGRMLSLRVLFAAVFAVCASPLFSQNISGRVLESKTQAPIQDVKLRMVHLRDSSLSYTAYSDSLGVFNIHVNKGMYRVIATKGGYGTQILMAKVFEADAQLGDILLNDSAKSSLEAKIIGKAAPVQQNGDTTEYSSAAYKVNPDATAADLIKKMPGITVENGKIMAQGEEVKKVTLDGKDFFGSDAQTALNNLPAEVVERIQVFQRMSDQAQFTGFDDGQSVRAINIKTKSGKATGVFGKAYAGYGTDNRYNSGLNYNNFNNTRRVTVLGMANNINIQNFSSQDLVGINSGGGSRTGGYRRSSPGDNFLTSQSGGISATQALGFNYNDKWGKKITIGASYFFNYVQNTQNQVVFRNYFNSANSETGQIYQETSNITNKPLNHRLNVRLEYNIDSSNSIIYTPTFSWQSTQYDQGVNAHSEVGQTPINASISNYTNQGIAWNLSNQLLFRHKFQKTGRTFSINLEQQYNAKNINEYNYSQNNTFIPLDTFITDQRIKSNNPTQTYSARLSYTEPLTKTTMLQFDYNLKATTNDNDKSTINRDPFSNTYQQFDTLLSNKYNTLYQSQEPGLMIRHRGEKLMIGAGTGYQIASLTGNQTFPIQTDVKKYFGNVLPRVFLNYKINKNTNLRGMFRTSTNVPSVSQLQNVINTSNPLIISTGNPKLLQEVARNFMLNFNKSNPIKLTNVYFGVSGSQTSNYIANVSHFLRNDSTISEGFTALRGSQLTKPENLNGYWNAKVFGNYGFPLKKLKTNANINGSYGVGQTPGIVNDIKNLNTSQNITGGLVLSSNVSEDLDFTISYFGNYTNTTNNVQSSLNNTYFIHTGTARVNYLIHKKISLSSDFNYNKYAGLSSTFNQTFMLWNAGVGYKFLKANAAEIKLTCFDILKQNRSITRTVYASYYEDNATKVITRYFMLTFTYNFRKFDKGVKEPEANDDPHGFGPPKGMPGNPPGPEKRPPYQP